MCICVDIACQLLILLQYYLVAGGALAHHCLKLTAIIIMFELFPLLNTFLLRLLALYSGCAALVSDASL